MTGNASMITNYFKVLAGGALLATYQFDESSLDSIRDAWELARAKRDEAPALVRKIVVWRKIPLTGAWSGCAVTFLSGLQDQFVRDYQ